MTDRPALLFIAALCILRNDSWYRKVPPREMSHQNLYQALEKCGRRT